MLGPVGDYRTFDEKSITWRVLNPQPLAQPASGISGSATLRRSSATLRRTGLCAKRSALAPVVLNRSVGYGISPASSGFRAKMVCWKRTGCDGADPLDGGLRSSIRRFAHRRFRWRQPRSEGRGATSHERAAGEIRTPPLRKLEADTHCPGICEAFDGTVIGSSDWNRKPQSPCGIPSRRICVFNASVWDHTADVCTRRFLPSLARSYDRRPS